MKEKLALCQRCLSGPHKTENTVVLPTARHSPGLCFEIIITNDCTRAAADSICTSVLDPFIVLSAAAII
jgi:hypothetical protein